jgi:triosephosphate isomerase (TIM)
MRKKIVAGNWKMNKTLVEANELFDEITNNNFSNDVSVIISPPSIYLSQFARFKKGVYIASQNVSQYDEGAYTGEISAKMLKQIGVDYCLVGHSERRSYFNEKDKILAEKTNRLLENNIKVIFCCGESLNERKTNRAEEVIELQLKESLFHISSKEIENVVIAYEPVWAIGTGLTATSEQAQDMHSFIRTLLRKYYNESISNRVSILYGGSCKASNAKDIFSKKDVDGGLIGGAALESKGFSEIIKAF